MLAELSRLVRLEKKLDSLGLLGVYGSCSSASSWWVASCAATPFVAGGVVVPLAVAGFTEDCAGAEPGLSGVVCCEDENFELMLFSHEVRRPPVSLVELERPSRPGRLECALSGGVPFEAGGGCAAEA